MSEWIRIRVKDFYKDAVGELEYTYVTREVYEALVDTFRKEAHAQEMRDIRHTTKDGYTEGETEDLVELTGESVEDTVIRQMEIETLQKAMQSLTPVQRERLHFYFFEGMTYRQIAAKEGVGEKNIRESINGAVKKITKYFRKYMDNERNGLSNIDLISEIVSDNEVIAFIKKHPDFQTYEQDLINKSYQKIQKKISLSKENQLKGRAYI